MKVVLNVDISPKLIGVVDEQDLAEKLGKRCMSIIKSYEKKWEEQNEDLCEDPDREVIDEAEIDWAELIQEGFQDMRKSVTVRVWGQND